MAGRGWSDTRHREADRNMRKYFDTVFVLVAGSIYLKVFLVVLSTLSQNDFLS